MRIAYFSLDEVNRHFVRRWARRQGSRLVCPSVAAIGEFTTAGMVVDVDFLPEPIRGNWIKQALAGAIEGPVLVHGHSLTDAEARGLRRRGFTVCQGRLRRRIFQAWILAMSATEIVMS